MENPSLHRPQRHHNGLHDETLESISNLSDLSLESHNIQNPKSLVTETKAKSDEQDSNNTTDSDTSINIKNSTYTDSHNNSNDEVTLDDQDLDINGLNEDSVALEEKELDDEVEELHSDYKLDDYDDNENGNEYEDQYEGESAAAATADEVEDDDAANKFLNSSSFMSQSQIIRTDNLNSYQPTNEKIMSSPTPALKSLTPRTKKHFNFSKSKVLSSDLSDNSDQSDNEEPHNKNGIDIDNPKSTPKLPKIHPDTTPWRKLRPASALPPKSVPRAPQANTNFMKSLFDDDMGSFKSPTRSVSLYENSGSDTLSTTVTSSFEIENLKKQITNYKLQQRLLTEFIRNIIKNTGNGDGIKNDIMERLERENETLFSERERLQKDLKDNIITNEENESAKLTEKMREIVDLKNDLITTRDLNTELNSYIDELKSRAEEQGLIIDRSNVDADRWESLINDILSLLLEFLDGESGKAVLQARDNSNSLDTKLKIVSLAVNEILEKFVKLSHNLSKASSFNPTAMNSVLENTKDKLHLSKKIEQDLRALLKDQSETLNALKSEFDSLQNQFKQNLLFVASLKKLLSEKRTKIAELNDIIIRLETELEEQCSTQTTNPVNEKETQLLRNRLTVIKTNHSKEVENLHTEIDNLKLEIEDLKHKGSISSKHAPSDTITGGQEEMDTLQHEIKSLRQQLDGRDDQTNTTISNLKSLLRQAKDDYEALVQEYHHIQQQIKDVQGDKISKDKEYRRKLEHAAKELNLAVAKQRSLAAEKSKLTFALEDSKREHSLLKLNNSTLTEKVGKLSYQVSTLTNYELGFNSLFQSQVTNFENLLHHFDSILEESSVNQARQKLNKLLDAQLDFDQAQAIMRSLTSYFENATSSLIADHSQLLINSNIEGSDSQAEINKLKRQIDSMSEELQWYIVNYRDRGDLSPRSKLRIDELEKRRKAERERRKLENEAAHETIQKLEKENKELKEKLKQIR